MRRRGARGWTVAETMVAAAVFAVLMSAVVQLFVMSIRASQRGQDQVELQQHAIFFLSQWDRDLSQTMMSALQGYQGQGYAVVSMSRIAPPARGGGAPGGSAPGPISSDQLSSWQQNLVAYVYNEEERTVQRFLFDNSSDPFKHRLSYFRPYLASAGELQTVATQGEVSAKEARTALQNVEEFYFADGKGLQQRFLTSALHLRFQLRKEEENERAFSNFTVERRYTLRNNY